MLFLHRHSDGVISFALESDDSGYLPLRYGHAIWKVYFLKFLDSSSEIRSSPSMLHIEWDAARKGAADCRLTNRRPCGPLRMLLRHRLLTEGPDTRRGSCFCAGAC